MDSEIVFFFLNKKNNNECKEIHSVNEHIILHELLVYVKVRK